MHGGVSLVEQDIIEYVSWPTLDSRINIGVRLLIFEKKLKEKMKNDFNVLFDVKMS